MQNACKHGFSLSDLQLRSFIDILYSTETQEKPRSNFVIVVEPVFNNAQWEVSERREKKKSCDTITVRMQIDHLKMALKIVQKFMYDVKNINVWLCLCVCRGEQAQKV